LRDPGKSSCGFSPSKIDTADGNPTVAVDKRLTARRPLPHKLRHMNSKLLFSVLAAVVFASAPLGRAASGDTVLLNTLGYTTGQSVLLTHMAVGTLADAFVAKTYKSGQATEFVTTYINMMTGMKGQMRKLLDADVLSKADAQFISNTIEVLDLVLDESRALKEFVSSGDDADATAYDKARKKALKEIKTLLGMKD
jgi:hypothetical protein